MTMTSKETRQFPKQKRTWVKKKKYLQIDECGISLQAQRSISQWCVDSGCSKHMIGDKNKFVLLRKEKEGSVTFNNNKLSKIVGKGIVSLGNKDGLAKNVLLVENMKHKVLSVG